MLSFLAPCVIDPDIDSDADADLSVANGECSDLIVKVLPIPKLMGVTNPDFGVVDHDLE